MLSLTLLTIILLTIHTEAQLLLNQHEKLSVDYDVQSINDNTDKSKRELSKIQSTLITILQPVPIVDTIEEKEKYGNTGDKFAKVGRSVVGGVETVANLINSALNFPIDAVKKVSRTATEALNNLGGKLVGLQ